MRAAPGRGIAGGRTGSITVIERGGGGLKANPHVHALVFDGVFREMEAGMGIQATAGESPRASTGLVYS
jgi:hypothetical protein